SMKPVPTLIVYLRRPGNPKPFMDPGSGDFLIAARSAMARRPRFPKNNLSHPSHPSPLFRLDVIGWLLDVNSTPRWAGELMEASTVDRQTRRRTERLCRAEKRPPRAERMADAPNKGQ